MSYPPPPGANPSSLPPRPPPSKVSGFKPAFSTQAPLSHTPSPGIGASPYSAPPSYSGTAGHASAAPSYYGSTHQQYAPQGQGQMSGAGYQYPASTGYGQAPQHSYYGAPQADASSYTATPQIRNPFPAPAPVSSTGGGGGGHAAARPDENDPELAAQIAQWQSAYVKDPNDATIPGPTRVGPGGANTGASYPAAQAAVPDPNATSTDKKKTVVRAGGGTVWTDDTLLEWDPTHLRLFVGNLAGETTDESLHKAFSRWKSLQKARVIRDKVTSKSKGYGFVSFSDPDDFFQAAKEMNGKYIQSHPVRVSKATTEIKTVNVKDKHSGGKWNKNKNKNRQGGGSGGSGAGRGGNDGAYEAHLGAHGGGVTKPGQKTKGGLKLLG
ncbi:RNA-binding protein 42 [Microdochium nivale]|nr:RNA-binding protein 42 [Microdochium nivale]